MSNSKKNMQKMDKQGIWNLATEAVFRYLKDEGYQIEGVNPKYNVYPNVVASKNGKLYGVIIDAAEIHSLPSYSIKKTFDILRFANRFDAIPMYASVGIASSNIEKLNRHELYYDDPEGWDMGLSDLRIVNYDMSSIINKEEYKEYVANLLGYCYENRSFELIEKYLADDCRFTSFFSNNDCDTKKEVMNNYYVNSKKDKAKEITSYLIKFVGNWFSINHVNLKSPDGKIVDQNVKVTLPQPGGEIGLLIESIYEDGEKKGKAIAIKYNEDNLINDIYLGDPYAMQFDDYYKNEDDE